MYVMTANKDTGSGTVTAFYINLLHPTIVKNRL
jgi:hypothetical protein